MAISLDLRWFKVIDDKTHPVDRQFVHQKGSFGKEIAVLVFTNISKQDEGLYQCRRKTKMQLKRCGIFCNIRLRSLLTLFDTFPFHDWEISEFITRKRAFQLSIQGNF